jgi:hypothetical protein
MGFGLDGGARPLRATWRTLFGAVPPKGLSKDMIGRMVAYRIQEEAFGGLDRETVKLLDRLGRGEKPDDLNRPQKPVGRDSDNVPFPIVFPDKNGSGLKAARDTSQVSYARRRQRTHARNAAASS